MYSSEQQARDAAQIGLRILGGEAVKDIPVEKDRGNRFIFDHLMLQRFDISLSDLPPDSITKNRQYSFWELYQPQIITAITTIAVLLFLVVFLLGVTRKLNGTRLALAERTRELKKAYEDLQALDRLRFEFIDIISHELRTPVTNTNLYPDLLIKGKPENRPRYVEVLKKESSCLSNLLEAILDFATLQESLDKANLAAINLNGLVAREVASFEPQAQDRGLELSFSPDLTVPEVLGDPAQLQQVVSHLLQNAVSYNTLSGYVRVSTRQAGEGKSVCLTVADSGMGMDEEEIVHCFERFYRGKRVGEFKSEIDQGSTFSVSLPVR